MSFSHELEAGAWIKATLEAGSDFRAYSEVIPSAKTLPAFRFSCMSRDDIRTVAQHIAMSRYRFLVVATAQGEALERGPRGLVTLADYISNTLHRAEGETDYARIVACTRIETYHDQENVGVDVIRHAGAMFEIFVMGLPESE